MDSGPPERDADEPERSSTTVPAPPDGFAADIPPADALSVDILDDAGPWASSGFDPAEIERALQYAWGRLPGRAHAAGTAIILSDDAHVRALNARWRGVDTSTNVLSFPLPPQPAVTPVELGDIVLAFETASAEAEDRGVSLTEHAAHLAIHGLLHLAGYDHQTDTDAGAMEALESHILKHLGLADPYAGGDGATYDGRHHD